MENFDSSSQRLAILIDTDNTSPLQLPELLMEISKYGIASVRRAYGNWTSSHSSGWKNSLLNHAIQPIQQFSYSKGRNATDSALIIDAMDLLYGGRLHGFRIVSSDSDFTRLAARICEQELNVYGFGEYKHPKHSSLRATDSSTPKVWNEPEPPHRRHPPLSQPHHRYPNSNTAKL